MKKKLKGFILPYVLYCFGVTCLFLLMVNVQTWNAANAMKHYTYFSKQYMEQRELEKRYKQFKQTVHTAADLVMYCKTSCSSNQKTTVTPCEHRFCLSEKEEAYITEQYPSFFLNRYVSDNMIFYRYKTCATHLCIEKMIHVTP